MILTFLITHSKIAEIEVDLEKKTTKILYQADDLSLSAVLAKKDMTYPGLERRLQFLMDDNRSLPELIEHINLYDINTPIQYNLHVEVTA